MNYISILFTIMSTSVIIFGSLVNLLEDHIPHFLSQIFRYGKFSAKGNGSKLAIEVPKAWFKHFYVVAVFVSTYLMYLMTSVYIFERHVPEYASEFLDKVCGQDRVAHTPQNKVLIACFLLTIQIYRRFYDTHFVSVFGENSKINASHYLIGLIHYPGAAVAMICEAPFFAEASEDILNRPFNLWDLSISEKCAISLFLWAWWHQHICNKILGDLRKNKTGDVVSNEYKLPTGDWFEYLSAPHQTAEIIMYTCLMWLLWNSISWFFVFAWVMTNQVETILLSHWWYQEKFKSFPNRRKALIPFLY